MSELDFLEDLKFEKNGNSIFSVMRFKSGIEVKIVGDTFRCMLNTIEDTLRDNGMPRHWDEEGFRRMKFIGLRSAIGSDDIALFEDSKGRVFAEIDTFQNELIRSFIKSFPSFSRSLLESEGLK